MRTPYYIASSDSLGGLHSAPDFFDDGPHQDGHGLRIWSAVTLKNSFINYGQSLLSIITDLIFGQVRM